MNLYQPTITGSLSVSGSVNISGSITIAGGGTISGTASIATTALTASSADNLLVRNTLTAQTLVVQTITSSVDFVTGSTRFGSLSSNTHVFTGSMYVTGGLSVTSGSIGIGTINPVGMLDIQQSNITNMGISFMNTYGASGASGSTVDISSKLVGSGLTGQIGSMIRTGKEGDYSSGGARDAYMSFSTALDDNLVERMRITSAGDIGIGNTAFASTKLTITGKSNTSSDYCFVANNASNSNLFLVRNDGAVIANGPVYRYSGQTVVGGSMTTLVNVDFSSSRTYLLQMIAVESGASTNYRWFGVLQYNYNANSFASTALASQTMDVTMSGGNIQARTTNSTQFTFNWSITQLL
jgi:hypothetical protein